MEVTFSDKNSVTIISLAGKLDSASAGDVQDQVLEKITEGLKFVFDMSACTFVSSAGLRTLLIFAKRIKAENAKSAMAAVADEIIDVMEMTGFDNMFDTYTTVDEAVKALN